MTDNLIVFVTCVNPTQAESIARAVVEEKLAACVNVLPGVRSWYVWEEKLTSSDEVLLLIKTTMGRFRQLRDRVCDLHSYEVPEIVGIGIEDGLPAYLSWIQRSVE
jgi:periplasmic divalent cation tolerance protein